MVSDWLRDKPLINAVNVWMMVRLKCRAKIQHTSGISTRDVIYGANLESVNCAQVNVVG